MIRLYQKLVSQKLNALNARSCQNGERAIIKKYLKKLEATNEFRSTEFLFASVFVVLRQGATDVESPISVGSGCGSMMEQNLIINVESPANHYHFAITGNAFSVAKTLYPEILLRLLVRGTVFARMNPEQKQQLVEHLQTLGYFVGKCLNSYSFI